MFKLDKKGFALAETIIVSTFVLAIFTMIYTNLLPLMGEYEKRENYDDIDSVYKTYHIKDYIERNKVDISSNNRMYKTDENNENEFCYLGNSDSGYCMSMIEMFDVTAIIVTNYENSIDFPDASKSFQSYIDSLPNYSSDNQKKRIIVEYKVTVEREAEEGKEDIYRYSTIGVNV